MASTTTFAYSNINFPDGFLSEASTETNASVLAEEHDDTSGMEADEQEQDNDNVDLLEECNFDAQAIPFDFMQAE